MTPGLLRTFESFDTAQQARDALLAAGLQASQLSLEATADEAGPVEGNFLVGNGRDAGDETPDQPLPSGADPIYQRNFQRTVDRGSYRLVVEVSDTKQRDAASQVLDRFGGIDVEARASQGSAG